LEDRKIDLSLHPKARDWLTEKGWYPAYGARPLKRLIQRNVQDPLAQMILAGERRDASSVKTAAREISLLTAKGRCLRERKNSNPDTGKIGGSREYRPKTPCQPAQTPYLCMPTAKEEIAMSEQIKETKHEIKENMQVIGADGVHVGAVDRVVGNRIKLKKRDSYGMHEGHHYYVEIGFVAGVEGDTVRLSANADIAVTLEEEKSGRPVDL
jgi:hypothetical protein